MTDFTDEINIKNPGDLDLTPYTKEFKDRVISKVQKVRLLMLEYAKNQFSDLEETKFYSDSYEVLAHCYGGRIQGCYKSKSVRMGLNYTDKEGITLSFWDFENSSEG